MRNFFCFKSNKKGRNPIYLRAGKGFACLYLCCVLGLSYRLLYNEYYVEFYEEVNVSNENGTWVYPLGEIVGIYTECDGIFVIDTCQIESRDNEFVSPVGDVLRTGDYILQVNGVDLTEKEVLVKAVNESEGKALELTVVREETIFSTNVTPVLGKSGKYMLGVWVKDDLAGVGTITFYTKEGSFAALGHGMGDGVTKELLMIRGGDVYVSEMVGIKKGEKGEPGEVKGVIYYGTANHLGQLDTNCNEGIYGVLDEEDVERYTRECSACEIGNKQDIQVGKAQIISDVSGQRQIYDIEITYVDYLAINTKKGLHIEVTDPELLELTGGIVQGMSGSPIIQNGKLIGAVTHVLVNDPTKGYGIFIEEMLK